MDAKECEEARYWRWLFSTRRLYEERQERIMEAKENFIVKDNGVRERRC